MSKKRANPAITDARPQGPTPELVSSSLEFGAVLPHREKSQGLKLGGAYRDRTDDPLLAKQVLSQLS